MTSLINPVTRFSADPFPRQQQEQPGLTPATEPAPDHGETSYIGTGRLSGLRTLITGGDSGIGRATAIAFAREGADVAISYLPEEQADADNTSQWIERAGQRSVLLPGDVRTEEQCAQLVSEVVQKFGGLDVLVLNAAYQRSRDSLETIPIPEIERVIETNLYAPLWTARAAILHLRPGSSSHHRSRHSTPRRSSWITR